MFSKLSWKGGWVVSPPSLNCKGNFMAVPRRVPIEQTFFNFPLVVGVVPTPVSSQIQLGSLIASMIFSNPSTNANSVFLGDQNVSLTSGIEIVVGSSPILSIQQTRQLYEVQDPTMYTAQAAMCQELPPVSSP